MERRAVLQLVAIALCRWKREPIERLDVSVCALLSTLERSYTTMVTPRAATYSAKAATRHAALKGAADTTGTAAEDTVMDGVVGDTLEDAILQEDIAMGDEESDVDDDDDEEEEEEEEETPITPAQAKAERSRLALKKADREADNNIGRMPDPSEEDLLCAMAHCVKKNLHSGLFSNIDLYRDANESKKKRMMVRPHSEEEHRLMSYRIAKEDFVMHLSWSLFCILSNTTIPKRSMAPVSCRPTE